ncbi:MAG: ribonuclease Z [Deltaproteobacteria bacterium]|nr:ribonuclease Z [Deltaproteobacteria bacterium]
MHIDHFVGFDHLLRLHLGRGRRVRVFGPPGITQCVNGKLQGYTWNLVKHQRLVFEVYEARGDEMQVSEFACRRRFRHPRVTLRPAGDLLFEDDMVRVRWTELDHHTPSMAYTVTERDFFNVNPLRLDASGLKPGSWLNHLKKLVRTNQARGAELEIDGQIHDAEALAGDLLIHTPGRTIGYIADSAASPENLLKAKALMQEVDLLYCEGAFLEADRARADQTAHMTAGQAGHLARAAGAKRLVVFHFSPKYEGRFEELEAEAEATFSGLSSS